MSRRTPKLAECIVFLSLLLHNLSGLAGEPDDSFLKAVAAIDARRYEAAEILLSKLVAQYPDNGLVWFNLGSARYNRGHFEAAQQAFAKVIQLKSPLLVAARIGLAKSSRHLGMQRYEAGDYEKALAHFETACANEEDSNTLLMKALTLLRLHRPYEAKSTFRQLLDVSREGDSREEAKYFLQQIETRMATGSLSLFADLGLGYNSNVYLEGNSITPTAQPTSQTFVGAMVQLPCSPPWCSRAAYLLYWEEVLGEISARFLSQTVRFDGSYDDGDWSLRLGPSMQYQAYGAAPFLLKAVVSGAIQKNVGGAYVGAQYDYGRNFGQQLAYHYLNGNTHAGRVSLGMATLKLDWNLFYLLALEDIGDLTDNNSTLPLNGIFHGPGVKLTWNPFSKWELVTNLSYQFREYRNLAQPDGATRSDQQVTGNVKVSYDLSRHIRPFGSVGILWNRSTLTSSSQVEDKNFSQFISLIGVSWDIIN